MKYRKKPVVIDAVQYEGPSSISKLSHLGDEPILPEGVEWRRQLGGGPLRPTIVTLEGDMIVSPGDWIITGVKGEKYPCKPDIFDATYEPVKETA